MAIYRNKKKRPKVNYRKIWKDHYGPIPKDETGRSYDIHHIDGNYSNNSIENLLAVSIQEHYDIHYSQGDWSACRVIARRMKLSPEVISELSSKNAKEVNARLMAEGKHIFQTNHPAKKLYENGTHPFIGGELQRNAMNKRVELGIHNFQTLKSKELARKTQNKRLNDGTHPFLDKEKARERELKKVEEGTHNLLGGVTCRDRQGNIVQVSQENYHKQKEITDNMTHWEFVSARSFEAKRRKNETIE
jgi:hypothetical protein